MKGYSIVAVVSISISVISATYALGIIRGETNIRRDAVKSGVAEYYIDQNNEKAFRWKGVNP